MNERYTGFENSTATEADRYNQEALHQLEQITRAYFQERSLEEIATRTQPSQEQLQYIQQASMWMAGNLGRVMSVTLEEVELQALATFQRGRLSAGAAEFWELVKEGEYESQQARYDSLLTGAFVDDPTLLGMSIDHFMGAFRADAVPLSGGKPRFDLAREAVEAFAAAPVWSSIAQPGAMGPYDYKSLVVDSLNSAERKALRGSNWNMVRPTNIRRKAVIAAGTAAAFVAGTMQMAQAAPQTPYSAGVLIGTDSVASPNVAAIVSAADVSMPELVVPAAPNVAALSAVSVDTPSTSAPEAAPAPHTSLITPTTPETSVAPVTPEASAPPATNTAPTAANLALVTPNPATHEAAPVNPHIAPVTPESAPASSTLITPNLAPSVANIVIPPHLSEAITHATVYGPEVATLGSVATAAASAELTTVAPEVAATAHLASHTPEAQSAATHATKEVSHKKPKAAKSHAAKKLTKNAAEAAAIKTLKARGGHWAVQAQVFEYFRQKGLTVNQAAGIVGNGAWESGGGSATIHQAGGGDGYGVFQFSGGLRAQLFEKPHPESLTTQLDETWSQMKKDGALHDLQEHKETMSVNTATHIFEKDFERAGKPAMSGREGYAHTFMSELQHQEKLAKQKAEKTHKKVVKVKTHKAKKQEAKKKHMTIYQVVGNKSDYNESQSKAEAPRTPIAKTLEKKGYNNGKLDGKELEILGEPWGGAELQYQAAESFRTLNGAFKKEFGHDIQLSASYRPYSRQVSLKDQYTAQGRPQFAATPGHSNHGWGVAIDIAGLNDSFDSPEYKWFDANAIKYGWVHPAFAASGSNAPEPWHWEYNGKLVE